MYFLRADAFDVNDRLAPSGRGEFEITDVLNHYIPGGGLFTRVYDGHWTDAGTVPSLLRAAELAGADHDAGHLAPPPQRPQDRRAQDRVAPEPWDGTERRRLQAAPAAPDPASGAPIADPADVP